MPAKNLPEFQLKRGSFLIASPDVDSGPFFRSVVLLCEHSAAGSFGLIVNKPLNIEIPQEIASLGEIVNSHIQMRMGGPLQPNQMMLLHNQAELQDQTLELAPNLYLGGNLEFLQQAISQTSGPSVHLCFGYAGWTAGYLEREYLDGQWFITPASAPLLFDSPPEKLWATLLRQMGGKYATLSMIPEDLSVN